MTSKTQPNAATNLKDMQHLAPKLDLIASGNEYSESVLKAALQIPGISDRAKLAIENHLAGTVQNADCWALQELAIDLRNGKYQQAFLVEVTQEEFFATLMREKTNVITERTGQWTDKYIYASSREMFGKTLVDHSVYPTIRQYWLTRK